jgi:hypothetical protein
MRVISKRGLRKSENIYSDCFIRKGQLGPELNAARVIKNMLNISAFQEVVFIHVIYKGIL